MRSHPAITWRTRQVRLLREFGGHRQPVRDVAFTPDGSRLVSIDGTEAKTWDITAGDRGALVRTAPLPGACGLIPDGTLALGRNGELRRTDDGSLAAEVGEIGIHAFSHDGTLLARAARNKPWMVVMPGNDQWSVQGPDGIVLSHPEQRQLIVDQVAFRQYFLSQDDLNTTSLKTEGVFSAPAEAPGRYGFQRVGVNFINSLSVIDIKADRELRALALDHAHLFVDIAVSGSARLVAVRIPTGEVILTDIDSKKRVHSFDSPPAQSLLNALVFSPASDRILLADVSAPANQAQNSYFIADRWRRAGASMSPPLSDGSEHTDMSMWDVATGSLAGSSTIGARYGAITFSPDGRLIAALAIDGHVSLLDADTLKALSTVGAHKPTVPPCLAFSPDGSLLATGGDRDVKVWGL